MSEAKDNCNQILEKTENFCKHLRNCSLSADYLNFLGFSFQSYACNVWWGISEDSKKEWFSVWEGNCLFHSTVDVEYNIAVFYLMLWPELLVHQIEHWREYKQDGFISHDCGAVLDADKSVYPHDMEIEENSNFILLLFALFRLRGRTDILARHYQLLKELVAYNIRCDLTGNGLPNLGTANTIDDSSDDVQFAQEQIYIGIKEYAAYCAAKKMARFMEDISFEKLCEKECEKIKKTIEDKGWLGDHYGVNLISSNGSINPNSLYQSVGKISTEEGMNAYSIYTTNGFLYLFLCGEDILWDRNRLREDIIATERACSTPFGCTHSSVDKSNIWISQNIFRDLCAGYLGIDFSDHIQKYWAFEIYENQGARGGCFIDTYGWNKLNYYPRGITSIGYLYSMVGIEIDDLCKIIKMQPVKVPLKVPLLHFADWEKNRVPIVSLYLEHTCVKYSVENQDLLSPYKIII